MKVEHHEGVFAIELHYEDVQGIGCCFGLPSPEQVRRYEESIAEMLRMQREAHRLGREEMHARAQWMASQEKHRIEMAMAATEAV